MLLGELEKQAYLSDALDNIDMFVWIKDRKNNLLYLNKTAKEGLIGVFGKIGFDGREPCPLSCDVTRFTDEVENVIEDINVNGSKMYLKCKKIPIKKDGDVVAMIVLARDYTSQMEKEMKLKKELDEKLDVWNQKRLISLERSKKEMMELNNVIDSIRERSKKWEES